MARISGFYHDIDPWELPPYWKAPVKKHRRARFNDYTGRRIYMITVVKDEKTPILSSLAGNIRDTSAPVRVVLTPTGEMVNRCVSAIPSKFPHCSIIDRVVMPDHVHFIIFVRQKTDIHLGTIIGRFTGDCTRGFAEMLGLDDAIVKPPFFEPGYDDQILYRKGGLEVMKNYVRDNPRRLALRRSDPKLFNRSLIITADGERLHAYGNMFLLKNADRRAVRLSRKFSAEKTAQLHDLWQETCRNGGVLVSPFISPAEKEVRDMAIREGAPIILVAPQGFRMREHAKGRAFDLCAEGRLLVISRPGVYAGTGVLTRRECLEMNDLASTIAETDYNSLLFRREDFIGL